MTKTSDYNAADPWQIIADLQRRLDESFAQQAATAEVMQLINASPGDLTPVFDAIVDKAMHLCGAGFGGLWVVDGDMARAAATRNLPEPYVEFLTRRPVLLVGAIPFDRVLRQLLDAEWGLFDDTRHTVFARSSAINSAPD